MSSIRSALEEFRREDLTWVPDARLEEDFEELQRSADRLEAERLRRLGEIARRRTYERDGFLSAAAWLSTRFNVGWSAAGQQVRMAEQLRGMPRTLEAMSEGEVSPSAARVLA